MPIVLRRHTDPDHATAEGESTARLAKILACAFSAIAAGYFVFLYLVTRD
jgi:hypothetical protein